MSWRWMLITYVWCQKCSTDVQTGDRQTKSIDYFLCFCFVWTVVYKLSLKTFGDSLFHDFVWIMLPTSLKFTVFWSENHYKLTLCLIGNRLTTSLLDTIPEFPVDLDALESHLYHPYFWGWRQFFRARWGVRNIVWYHLQTWPAREELLDMWFAVWSSLGFVA